MTLQEQLDVANENIEQLHDSLTTEAEARMELEGHVAHLNTVIVDLLDDKTRLDVFEHFKDYIIGLAPSGQWAVFLGHPDQQMREANTFYGDTLREALDDFITYHIAQFEQEVAENPEI